MGGDATNWDESAYRASIAKERELQARTVFRTIFAPSQNPIPETIVAASSDGSVAPYSISSCISSYPPAHLHNIRHQKVSSAYIVAEPLCLLQGHDGPAYDVKFYGQGEDSLLLSCGDDGRIQGWRWKEILNSDLTHASHMRGNHLMSVLDLVNPQHRGPWGALSPTPENNAIAVDDQLCPGHRHVGPENICTTHRIFGDHEGHCHVGPENICTTYRIFGDYENTLQVSRISTEEGKYLQDKESRPML